MIAGTYSSCFHCAMCLYHCIITIQEKKHRKIIEKIQFFLWNSGTEQKNDDIHTNYERKDKMKILIIEPHREPYETDINLQLKTMQTLVGGYIQILYPFSEDPEIALICNDEGKLMGLPLNRPLFDEDGMIYDIIAGTFFLCRAPADSESFMGLEEEQIIKYKHYFFT